MTDSISNEHQQQQEDDEQQSAAFLKLNASFDKTLEKIVQSYTFEQFVQSFPQIYASHPKGKELLYTLYTTLIMKFIENARVT
jgi:hypothetical protein